MENTGFDGYDIDTLFGQIDWDVWEILQGDGLNSLAQCRCGAIEWVDKHTDLESHICLICLDDEPVVDEDSGFDDYDIDVAFGDIDEDAILLGSVLGDNRLAQCACGECEWVSELCEHDGFECEFCWFF